MLYTIDNIHITFSKLNLETSHIVSCINMTIHSTHYFDNSNLNTWGPHKERKLGNANMRAYAFWKIIPYKLDSCIRILIFHILLIFHFLHFSQFCYPLIDVT